MTESEARRGRRRRPHRPKPTATATPQPEPGAPTEPTQAIATREAPTDHGDGSRGARREPGGRGLRDLVGAGPSQLGVSGALRGRDANRPDDDDLAAAERDVVIVRRHWKPPS